MAHALVFSTFYDQAHGIYDQAHGLVKSVRHVLLMAYEDFHRRERASMVWFMVNTGNGKPWSGRRLRRLWLILSRLHPTTLADHVLDRKELAFRTQPL